MNKITLGPSTSTLSTTIFFATTMTFSTLHLTMMSWTKTWYLQGDIDCAKGQYDYLWTQHMTSVLKLDLTITPVIILNGCFCPPRDPLWVQSPTGSWGHLVGNRCCLHDRWVIGRVSGVMWPRPGDGRMHGVWILVIEWKMCPVRQQRWNRVQTQPRYDILRPSTM